jgi:DNA (cytosine-5)-methyltransferase 1
MNHLGLFEGIGGFSLAARWMGWNTVAWCEINEFCQKVLKYHFAEAIPHGDIKTTDFSIYNGRVDIVTGGAPCQPYSSSGKRKGTDDNRHLWSEMYRAIKEIRPSWIVFENVYGLVNWRRGLVFNEIKTNLEAEKYQVASFVLPACSKEAPHERSRLWVIANAIDTRAKGERQTRENKVFGFSATANSKQPGLEGRNRSRSTIRSNQGSEKIDWACFPTKWPVRGRDDGFSGQLDGITLSKWHKQSIEAFGNAIVPQVAYELFKAIESINNTTNGLD